MNETKLENVIENGTKLIRRNCHVFCQRFEDFFKELKSKVNSLTGEIKLLLICFEMEELPQCG